ncbi:hypothetical protein FEV53_20030 [Palleronia caenipelagi]|uniref:Uncharacterized protein n=1 Tax=Palleronia caenipelagi TaxID=2489174 RepID=A0A547PHX1_9RHOB|nr:hypothetical protein FEV53_20030 [Palleronia caenipelagi]
MISSKRLLKEQDAIADFCEAKGIEAGTLARPDRANQSLNRKAQAFLMQFNPAINKAGQEGEPLRPTVNRVLDKEF